MTRALKITIYELLDSERNFCSMSFRGNFLLMNIKVETGISESTSSFFKLQLQTVNFGSPSSNTQNQSLLGKAIRKYFLKLNNLHGSFMSDQRHSAITQIKSLK